MNINCLHHISEQIKYSPGLPYARFTFYKVSVGVLILHILCIFTMNDNITFGHKNMWFFSGTQGDLFTGVNYNGYSSPPGFNFNVERENRIMVGQFNFFTGLVKKI